MFIHSNSVNIDCIVGTFTLLGGHFVYCVTQGKCVLPCLAPVQFLAT